MTGEECGDDVAGQVAGGLSGEFHAVAAVAEYGGGVEQAASGMCRQTDGVAVGVGREYYVKRAFARNYDLSQSKMGL